MPLLSRGSFDQFEAVAGGPTADEFGLTSPQPLSVLREVTRALQPVPLKFTSSARMHRVTLSQLRLCAGARVMLRRIVDPQASLHVLCWSWDLSARPVLVGPAPDADAATWTVPLRGAERRLDEGDLELVPPRKVAGGQVLRVILWQSDRGAAPGEVTDEVRAAIRHSRLATALAGLASAEVTVMSAVAVREAAGELGREIAPVLRALCSDYVDFFEGFYPVTGSTDADHVCGFQSELSLRV